MNDQSQKVLTVRHQSLEEYYKSPGLYCDEQSIDLFFRLLQSESQWVRRAIAESDSSLAQIVACAVVRHENRIFCMQRSNKGHRRQLRRKYTMMFGGHVEAHDQLASDEPLRQVLMTCLCRELREELAIRVSPSQFSLIGLVTDPLTESGWLHLGIVFDLPIESSSIFVTKHQDLSEFVRPNEDREICARTVDEIALIKDQLDPWSKEFFSSRAPDRINGSENRPIQGFFPFISRDHR